MRLLGPSIIGLVIMALGVAGVAVALVGLRGLLAGDLKLAVATAIMCGLAMLAGVGGRA